MKTAHWIVFCFLAASGLTARAETAAATADKVNGNVYVTTASGQSKRLLQGDTIPVGSLVHTNADSSASLKLVPGATAVLASGTDVTITTLKYSVASNGDKIRKIKLTLKTGELICSLAKHDGHSQFLVVTPMGTTKAIGTDWAVSFTASAGVTVATVDGVVTITLPNGHVVTVPGGQITTSPNGTTTVTGHLTESQIQDIRNALGNNGGGGGGTYSLTPVSRNDSNPANTSSNSTISPNR